jgi:N-acetylglucosamine-6-phosphate deacetylase
MIVLSGAALVLPDSILTPGTIVIDGTRIAEVRPGSAPAGNAGSVVHLSPRHYIVPGYVDVHVHGIEGVDSLDTGSPGPNPVAAMAAKLPRYGVTAFCPTTVACGPGELASVLRAVRTARATPAPRAARVLPAHLESNFINPEFCGAQPLACLRSPRAALYRSAGQESSFAAADLLAELEAGGADVGIVTLAPELEGGLELIRRLVSRGCRVSVGHSGATYEQGVEAIAAGARHATHLFNRMPPLGHRAPGLVGAILESAEIAAEIICDGYHVHPAVVRAAIAAKGASRIMAITDGTALSGLPVGSRAVLGGQTIVSRESAAFLTDGTMAGSVLTMDRAFRLLVRNMGLSILDAATVCATTPAHELGLAQRAIVTDAIADLVVLDDTLSVVQTYIDGELAYSRAGASLLTS